MFHKASLLLYLCPLIFAQEIDLESVENRLRHAKSLSFDFEITASEAVAASYRGHLKTTSDNDVQLTAEGSFQGAPVKPSLKTEHGKMMTPDHNLPLAPDLADTLRVGLMRKGILHHMAVLSLKQPIDGIEGVAAKTWILKSTGPAKAGRHENVETVGLPFELTVDGIKSATGILWVSKQTGLPVQRDQDVIFGPDQMMKVVEIYRNMAIQS